MRTARSEAGFTMVEVLVAAVLLIVGVLASLMLLDTGAASTAASLQRDTANAIAQEVVERATGLEYTKVRNDLTDVRPGDSAPTPADRIQRSMDPDGDQQSTAPTTDDPDRPWASTSSWTLRRGGTTYAVTYRACTRSDAVQGLEIMGPYDCRREATDPTGSVTGESSQCSLALFGEPGGDPDGPPAGDVSVRVLLLNAVGLQACVGGTLAQLGLGPLADGLCQLLGDGQGSILAPLTGALDDVLGIIASGADLGLCPRADVEQALADALGAIASTTDVTTTVRWDDRGHADRQHTIVQNAAIPRAAS